MAERKVGPIVCNWSVQPLIDQCNAKVVDRTSEEGKCYTRQCENPKSVGKYCTVHNYLFTRNRRNVTDWNPDDAPADAPHEELKGQVDRYQRFQTFAGMSTSTNRDIMDTLRAIQLKVQRYMESKRAEIQSLEDRLRQNNADLQAVAANREELKANLRNNMANLTAMNNRRMDAEGATEAKQAELQALAARLRACESLQRQIEQKGDLAGRLQGEVDALQARLDTAERERAACGIRLTDTIKQLNGISQWVEALEVPDDAAQLAAQIAGTIPSMPALPAEGASAAAGVGPRLVAPAVVEGAFAAAPEGKSERAPAASAAAGSSAPVVWTRVETALADALRSMILKKEKKTWSGLRGQPAKNTLTIASVPNIQTAIRRYNQALSDLQRPDLQPLPEDFRNWNIAGTDTSWDQLLRLINANSDALKVKDKVSRESLAAAFAQP